MRCCLVYTAMKGAESEGPTRAGEEQKGAVRRDEEAGQRNRGASDGGEQSAGAFSLSGIIGGHQVDGATTTNDVAERSAWAAFLVYGWGPRLQSSAPGSALWFACQYLSVPLFPCLGLRLFQRGSVRGLVKGDRSTLDLLCQKELAWWPPRETRAANLSRGVHRAILAWVHSMRCRWPALSVARAFPR